MISQNDPLLIRVPETSSVQNYQKTVSSIPKFLKFGVKYVVLGTRTISGNSFDSSLSLSKKQRFWENSVFYPKLKNLGME